MKRKIKYLLAYLGVLDNRHLWLSQKSDMQLTLFSFETHFERDQEKKFTHDFLTFFKEVLIDKKE